MPFKIVPNDSERGYRLVQVNPQRDSETGRLSFTMHGYTPTPKTSDGYHAIVKIDLDADGRAVVTRLVIEPSETVQRADGSHRLREADERLLSPINSTTLGLVRFTEIVNRIAEVEEDYAGVVASELPEAGETISQSAKNLKKRGRRKDLAKDARHAEQVLNSMREGRGYLARLKDIDGDWTVSDEGIKKRVSRLRKDGWLHADYGKPGPTLVSWRKNHGTDEEESHGEDQETRRQVPRLTS
jgi:hypothetical protein